MIFQCFVFSTLADHIVLFTSIVWLKKKKKNLLLARLLGTHDPAPDKFWACRHSDSRRQGHCRKADTFFHHAPPSLKRSSWFKKLWDAFSRNFPFCFLHFFFLFSLFFKGWVISIVCKRTHFIRGILLILCGLLTSYSVLAAHARISFWKYRWGHDTVKNLALRAM